MRRFSPLSEADLSLLDKQRAVVTGQIDEKSRSQFSRSAIKLGTLRLLLEDFEYTPDRTYELQCMGVVFGDVLANEIGLNWVVVDDEYGRGLVLRNGNTSLTIAPITMISKRVERGERVDVYDLLDVAWRAVSEAIEGGVD